MKKVLREISNSIVSRSAAIFKGAEFSHNSGLPLVKELEKKILAAIGMDEVDVPFNFKLKFWFRAEKSPHGNQMTTMNLIK